MFENSSENQIVQELLGKLRQYLEHFKTLSSSVLSHQSDLLISQDQSKFNLLRFNDILFKHENLATKKATLIG